MIGVITKRIIDHLRDEKLHSKKVNITELIEITTNLIGHFRYVGHEAEHTMIINNLTKYIHPVEYKKMPKSPKYLINIDEIVNDEIHRTYIKKMLKKNSYVEEEEVEEHDSDDEPGEPDRYSSEIDIMVEFNYAVKLLGYDIENPKPWTPIDRRDKIFSPFGTQWIHDPEQVDDPWTELHQKRANTFDILRAIEVPEQRTQGWFDMRYNRITASDGGSVVGVNEYEPPFKFVLKKVFDIPFDGQKNCYHGKKYEDTASMIYQYRMNVKVENFGLMKHPTIPFLAASPDGIVGHYKMDGIHKTQYVGRMLEIKCVVSRKINTDCEIVNLKNPKKGIVPAYYWVQVQQQLECCDLDECDFWQAQITEYPNRDLFVRDTMPREPFRSAHTKMEKGVIIQLIPKNRLDESKESKEKYDSIVWDDAKIINPPRIEMDPAECDAWIAETLATYDTQPEYKDYVFDRVFYWRMEDFSCVTIERDRDWFSDQIPIFEKMWGVVEFFRKNKDTTGTLFRQLVDLNRDKMKAKQRPPFNKKDPTFPVSLKKSIMNTMFRLTQDNASDYEQFVEYVKKEIEELKSTEDEKDEETEFGSDFAFV